MSTFLHGVGTVQFIDKSAEIVDIKGIDISSLAKMGIVNYEHLSTLPAQLVGKILKAKKIFKKEDCSNEHELYFWNKVKIPYVYIMAELLDDYCDSAKHVAGVLRYDRDKKTQNEYAIYWFSVEGSEIPNSRTNSQIVSRGIARKVTLTSTPCNQACAAEILENQAPKVKDDFEELFKSKEEAITLFKSGEGMHMYETFLAKKEMDKSETKGVPHGWTPAVSQHKRVGAITSLTHPEHGMVSVHKNPKSNKFEVNHAGRTAGIKGKKGVFDNHREAIGHMQKYVHALHNGTVLGRTMHAPDATDIKKALTAGSTNAAPSTLVNGGAYQAENLSRGPATTGAEENTFHGTKKKDWNKRAKEDYDRWPHKEKFEKFMQARMPHLAMGEIRAIGRVISLQKNIDLEKSLNDLILKSK